MNQNSNKYYIVICFVIGAFVIGLFWAGFLITSNMQNVADSMSNKKDGVQVHMGEITRNIQDMTKIMAVLSKDIHSMSNNFQKTSTLLETISVDMKNISDIKEVAVKMESSMDDMASSIKYVKGINTSVADISGAINNINKSVYMMGRDVNMLSRGISGPMNIMNSMPFPF